MTNGNEIIAGDYPDEFERMVDSSFDINVNIHIACDSIAGDIIYAIRDHSPP